MKLLRPIASSWVMLGLAALLVLRVEHSPLAWMYALGAAIAIEGEPIWGPAPVLVAEAGALALLSLAALRPEPAPTIRAER